MRRVILPLLFLCLAAPSPSRAETAAELITQLEAVSPDTKVVTRLDAHVMRSIESLEVVNVAPLNLTWGKRPAYYQDAAAGVQVALLSAAPAPAAPPNVVESGCDVNNLVLVDVSCTPPHGSGPDGRAWVRLTCGGAKTPTPYDWQLARLSGAMADIFVWHSDPEYAFVQGVSGSYQAMAVTSLGDITLNLTLQPSCRGLSRPSK